ncbi:MAG: hypothetical protein IKO68_11685 [Oscillospiraceae bacterium]|nr:hypothetical protein [Oscillospiraceae bacterium]
MSKSCRVFPRLGSVFRKIGKGLARAAKASIRFANNSLAWLVRTISGSFFGSFIFYSLAILLCAVGLLAVIFRLLPSEGILSVKLNELSIGTQTTVADCPNAVIDLDIDELFLYSENSLILDLSADCLECTTLEGKRIKLDSRRHYEVFTAKIDGGIHFIRQSTPESSEPSTSDSGKKTPFVQLELDNPNSYFAYRDMPVNLSKTKEKQMIFSYATDYAFQNGKVSHEAKIISCKIAGPAEIVFDSCVDIEDVTVDYTRENFFSAEITKITVPEDGIQLSIWIDSLPYEKDGPKWIEGTVGGRIEFDYSSSDYEFWLTRARTIDTMGDGSLFYSSSANIREYSLHAQKLHSVLSEPTDLHYYKNGDEESLSFEGQTKETTISGYSVSQSFISWVCENTALLPSLILTVFGGSISITGHVWKKKQKKDIETS